MFEHCGLADNKIFNQVSFLKYTFDKFNMFFCRSSINKVVYCSTKLNLYLSLYLNK